MNTWESLKPSVLTKRTLAIKGEEFATNYLRRSGFRILERNWRTPNGEIDIIAFRAGVLAVVEVKTRKIGSVDDFLAINSIDTQKAQRIRAVAEYYAQRNRSILKRLRIRFTSFDLAAVEYRYAFKNFFPILKLEYHADYF